MRLAGRVCSRAAAALLALAALPQPAASQTAAGNLLSLKVGGAAAGVFPIGSGIGSSNEVVDHLVQAPDGSQITQKVPGRTNWSGVLLERGLSENRFLWEWRREVETDASTFRRNFDIALLDADGGELAHWYCFKGWPSRISAPGSPGGADFAVEAVTLVAEQCYRGAVTDTTPPELLLPGSILAEATSAAGAAVAYAASAYDALDPAPAISCAPPSGSLFPIGATGVSCTATDASGNGASGGFVVTVQDTTAPALTLPADILAEATSPAGATVSFAATASDAVDSAPAVSCIPSPGSVFPLGVTTVACTATDAAGNGSNGSFTVTVRDTTAPQLTLPADIIAEATSPAGAAVSFTATATDAADASPAVSCAPPAGSVFPLGTTTVSCTATDVAGNSASGTFTVTVRDTAAPQLNLPADIVAEATSPAGAAVSFTATAADVADPAPVVVCAPPSGSTFPLGGTSISCTATDDSGNSASGTFTVTVRDTTAPEITVPADLLAEATSPAGAAVSFTATATDVADPAPLVACAPPSGSTFPPGATSVTCTATDAAGNVASGTFTVTVRDTTAPSITLGIVEPPPYTTSGPLTLRYVVSDAGDPAPAVTVELSNNGDPLAPPPVLVAPAPAAAGASTDLPLDPRALAGRTTIRVTATDAAGNVGREEISFEVILRLAPGRVAISPEVMRLPVGLFAARVAFPAPYDAWTIASAAADGAPSVRLKLQTARSGSRVTVLFFRRSRLAPPVDTVFTVRGTFSYKGAACTFEGTDRIRRVFTGD